MAHKARRPVVKIADVQEIMGTICDKWALQILEQLTQGTKRNSDLHRGIPGITPTMLTQTLRKLEGDSLVKRTIHSVQPPRVDYALTRLGETFTAPLRALYRWTERHVKEIHRARLASLACASTSKPTRSAR